MGEIAEMMLEGFLDEETGEVIDGESPGYPRRMSGRRAEREFDRARPVKTVVPCVHPGCKKKFASTAAYRDFLLHWQDKHAKSKG